MSVQLAQGVLKSREDVQSPWENIMVEVSPNSETTTLASNFAPAYNSSHTYNAGDRCTNQGVFYKAKVNNVTGAWDVTKWDAISVDTLISNTDDAVEDVADIAGSGQLNQDFTATDLTEAVNELKTDLNHVAMTPATAFSVAANGSVTKSVTGMTDQHVLILWNFTSGNDIIAENSPPSDLSWTTANGQFTIQNTGSTAVTIKPVFVLPEVFTLT